MKSNGAGKYDPELSVALESASATNGVLIVMNGNKGGGFAVQIDEDKMHILPLILESMATQIRDDLKQGGH